MRMQLRKCPSDVHALAWFGAVREAGQVTETVCPMLGLAVQRMGVPAESVQWESLDLSTKPGPEHVMDILPLQSVEAVQTGAGGPR